MTSWHLTIDCANPTPLVTFWAEALGYVPQPPPAGFDTWNDWYRSVGVPDDELDADGDGTDRLCDPAGHGPSIWFQIVPEVKSIKNRVHLDVFVGVDRSTPVDHQRQQIDAKVATLLALGGSIVATNESTDRYTVTMADPEGNELCVA